MKFEAMDVFQLGHALTLEVYRQTSFFPDTERFGLISQMRRAAVSICSNLTEGYHRGGKNEFRHFVGIARGSCGELSYQVLLAHDLGYVDETCRRELMEKCERVIRMLNKLATSLT